MNTHLHLMELLQPTTKLFETETGRRRLHELLDINTNTVYRKKRGFCTDKYDPDWTPKLDDEEFRIVSYGHDLGGRVAGDGGRRRTRAIDGPLYGVFETLWDYSLEYGYDHEHGGFYFYGGFDEPASFRVKAWWVQAECMTSALRTYERTGDDRYLDVFRETWDFIQQYHVDGEYGEWHSGVDEDLQPVGRKGRSTRARITTDGHFSSVSPPSNDYRFWEGNRSRGDPSPSTLCKAFNRHGVMV